jgi:hypothetical protein
MAAWAWRDDEAAFSAHLNVFAAILADVAKRVLILGRAVARGVVFVFFHRGGAHGVSFLVACRCFQQAGQ